MYILVQRRHKAAEYLGSLLVRTRLTNVSISDGVICFSSSLRLLCSSAVIVSSASTSYPICFCMNGNCFAIHSCQRAQYQLTTICTFTHIFTHKRPVSVPMLLNHPQTKGRDPRPIYILKQGYRHIKYFREKKEKKIS